MSTFQRKLSLLLDKMFFWTGVEYDVNERLTFWILRGEYVPVRLLHSPNVIPHPPMPYVIQGLVDVVHQKRDRPQVKSPPVLGDRR